MGAAAGAIVAASIGNAIKANGVLVTVTPELFSLILSQTLQPLVVMSQSGFFSPSYKYLTSYKGLAFYTKSQQPLMLPTGAELINAKSISIPQ